MENVVGLHRNHFGEIMSFVTSTGRVISYRKALMEVESGLLQGVEKTDDGHGHISLAPESKSTFDDYPNLF